MQQNNCRMYLLILILLSAIFVPAVNPTGNFPPQDYSEYEAEAVELQKEFNDLQFNGYSVEDVENAFPFHKFLNELRSQPNLLASLPDGFWKNLTQFLNVTISSDCATDISEISGLPPQQILRCMSAFRQCSINLFSPSWLFVDQISFSDPIRPIGSQILKFFPENFKMKHWNKNFYRTLIIFSTLLYFLGFLHKL